ncbi:MAG: COX15/CtaA family protein [Sulfurisoma sp.]|nr:COX15/CtaA family protein [Sulfurisoma sp.]
MHADVTQLPAMKKWVLLLAALSFLVVLISVFLRLDAGYSDRSGDAECFRGFAVGGLLLPIAAIRAMHRVTASASLILALFVTWSFLRPRPIQPAARYSLVLVLLMLFLAVVGLLGAGPDAVWARFANILGGLGLLSISGQLVLATQRSVTKTPRQVSSRILRVGIAALTATLVLGASIGARFAAAACTSLPDCSGIWWPTAEGWATLNPLLILSSAPLSSDASAVALHLLHRYCAGAAFLFLGFAGIRGLRQEGTRTASISLLLLLIIEMMLGGVVVATATNLWPMVGHALFAGLLLVSIHWLSSAASRASSRPSAMTVLG